MNDSYELQRYLSEEEISKFPVVKVEKGEVFIPIEKQNPLKLYYILEGDIDIFSLSYNGREFLIDRLGKGDFIGKFSQMRGFDFQCGVRAHTNLTMLDITQIKETLWDSFTPLGRFFHNKTSDRVYIMYKLSMLRMHFDYEEIFAFWLLKEKNEKNIVEDAKNLFCIMNVSDRQVYYLLKKFKDNGLIEKKKNQIKLINEEALSELAENVFTFMKG